MKTYSYKSSVTNCLTPYGSAIYIATGETGYIREIYTEKIWMKNKSEYLELFEFLQDKIR